MPIAKEWAAYILGFWFEEIARELWFKKDDAFDQRLRERFLATYDHVAALPPEGYLRDAETAVAAVIVLDQLPRNMFRAGWQCARGIPGTGPGMTFAGCLSPAAWRRPTSRPRPAAPRC